MKSNCGFKNKRAGYRFETEDNLVFQAIHVTRGKLFVTVDDCDQEVVPESCVLLPIGARFAMHCDTRPYRGVAMNIWETNDPYYRGDVRILPPIAEITRMAERIEHELLHRGVGSARILKHTGLLFVDLLIRHSHERGVAVGAGATSPAWVEMSKRSIEAEAYSGRPIQEIVGDVGVGYRQLSRAFRASEDMTPKQYQIACRVERAKRLLEGTSLSMTQIAMRLGYASSQHFSAQFAARTGLAPSAHRRAHIHESAP